MGTRIDDWLASALADAERRGLSELRPLLEGLARSLAGLRAADIELDARERRATDAGHPPGASA